MPSAFLSDAAKAALLAAAREIESRSNAEVVISVRPRSGDYLWADLLFGILTGTVTMALLLFLPQPFGLAWILVDPLIAGALGAFGCSRSPALRRILTPARLRRRRAEAAARALFVERRVHGTEGRTGALFYVSLLEREGVLVPDLGLEAAVALTRAWPPAVAELERAVRRGEDGAGVSRFLRELAAPLAAALPCRTDDVNELADEVDAP